MTVEILGPDGKTWREVPLAPCSRQYIHGHDATGAAGDLYKFRVDDAEYFPDPGGPRPRRFSSSRITTPNPANSSSKGAARSLNISPPAANPPFSKKTPNPQKPSSYEASKLVWYERRREPHALALKLYQTCLALRASDSAFRPRDRDSWEVKELSIGIAALHLRSKTGEWIVLFDLIGGYEGSLREETLFQAEAAVWNVVLVSNEARFGGDGRCALDLETMCAGFTCPETIVLRRQ